jgi:hypothetical protein
MPIPCPTPPHPTQHHPTQHHPLSHPIPPNIPSPTPSHPTSPPSPHPTQHPLPHPTQPNTIPPHPFPTHPTPPSLLPPLPPPLPKLPISPPPLHSPPHCSLLPSILLISHLLPSSPSLPTPHLSPPVPQSSCIHSSFLIWLKSRLEPAELSLSWLIWEWLSLAHPVLVKLCLAEPSQAEPSHGNTKVLVWDPHLVLSRRGGGHIGSGHTAVVATWAPMGDICPSCS